MRFLLIALILVAAVYLLRRALRSRGGHSVEQKPPVQGELVGCARCGVLVPRSEAREAAGTLYCSDEHARLGSG